MTENFKDWLIALLKAKNLTYEQLGELIGVSHGAVGGWVRGKYKPDPESIKKLSEVGNISVFKLLNWVYEVPLPDDAGERSQEIEQILQLAERMSEIEQEQLLRYIEFVMGEGRRGKDAEKTSVEAGRTKSK